MLCLLQASTEESGSTKRCLISQCLLTRWEGRALPSCSQSQCLHGIEAAVGSCLVWLCQHHLLLFAGKEPALIYLDHQRQFISQGPGDLTSQLAAGGWHSVICCCMGSAVSKRHTEMPLLRYRSLCCTLCKSDLSEKGIIINTAFCTAGKIYTVFNSLLRNLTWGTMKPCLVLSAEANWD